MHGNNTITEWLDITTSANCNSLHADCLCKFDKAQDT